jgi:hypothetical protein
MILYLTLKAHWFDMIDELIKLEEYREMKPFWVKRLCNEHKGAIGGDFMDKHKVIAYAFKKFTHVHFARGGHFHSSLPQRRFELNGIRIGKGKPEWGAVEGVDYFCLQIGKKEETP